MPGLHLYRSNRLETLADALAEVTSGPLRSVFQPEVVIVQSLGMRRWLSLQLAARHGVAINCEFPFPASFVQRVFTAAFPREPLNHGFDRELLQWRILGLLPRFIGAPAFEPLAHYLRGEMRALKEFQLAGKIASVFDRYLAYRPEMLIEWQRNRADQTWQPQLWRALVEGREETHTPALFLRLRELLRRGKSDLVALPERVSIFGVTSLPQLFVQLLGEVATRLEVHLFQLDPTDEFWGDIRSLKEQERILRLQKKRALTPEALHLETGHSLLASMARVGRDFSNLLLDLSPVEEPSLFSAPGGGTLLAQVQANIFHLQERAETQQTSVSPDDHSIQVHCCHSPMRELEALHDQLLALFEKDPALTPKDVLVTMPDVESYAPFIEAVFGAPDDPAHGIPFSIADRSARAQSCVASTFLDLLDLAGSRFGAGAVLALLETRPVQRRFDFIEADVETIRGWIERTGIRWGIDAEHRAALDLHPFEENTWRAGLRRMLLGYALPGDGETLAFGLLPLREIEGGAALVLGRFVEFAESLFALVGEFREARPLREWEHTFRRVLTTFFDESDESADEIRNLRAVFESLSRTQRDAAFDAPVEFDVIRAHLATALSDTDAGGGFLSGRVTFCSLKPMRSIPFKVICLLGMNDTAFPRRDAALAFDLIARDPKPGDRTLRDDDRQLFLETLLSARDALYISYCGLSPKDNSESPPSVLVSELLDYLGENFALPAGGSFIRKHRLQPFSADYFAKAGALFSYSAENCRASVTTRGERGAAPGFIGAPLPPPGDEWREVDLVKLADFFCHPSRFFVRDRLGLRLPGEAALLEEREPVELDRLVKLQLQQRLAARGLAGADLDEGRAVLRAGGDLPAGYVGDASFREMREEVAEFVERVSAELSAPPLPPLAVDLTLGEWRLTGTLHDLQPHARICHRATTIKPADQLRAWIFHLALNCSATDGMPRETKLFGTDATLRFIPVPRAAELLAELLQHYAAGLCAPLPLFPKTSHEFARRKLRPGPKESSDALSSASRKWTDGDFPESADPHHALCHGHRADPLDAAWQGVSLTVFAPLFAHVAP